LLEEVDSIAGMLQHLHIVETNKQAIQQAATSQLLEEVDSIAGMLQHLHIVETNKQTKIIQTKLSNLRCVTGYDTSLLASLLHCDDVTFIRSPIVLSYSSYTNT
jgi:hypothetical protein